MTRTTNKKTACPAPSKPRTVVNACPSAVPDFSIQHETPELSILQKAILTFVGVMLVYGFWPLEWLP